MYFLESTKISVIFSRRRRHGPDSILKGLAESATSDTSGTNCDDRELLDSAQPPYIALIDQLFIFVGSRPERAVSKELFNFRLLKDAELCTLFNRFSGFLCRVSLGRRHALPSRPKARTSFGRNAQTADGFGASGRRVAPDGCTGHHPAARTSVRYSIFGYIQQFL